MSIHQFCAVAALAVACASTSAAPDVSPSGSWVGNNMALDGSTAPIVNDSFGADDSMSPGSSMGGDFAVSALNTNPPVQAAGTPAVPEPTTYAMLLLGLAGVVAMTRRRTR